MPYVFRFLVNNVLEFSAPLETVRCSATTNGRRCGRIVCIGLPFCWQHLELRKHLKIMPSPINKMGLFAFNRSLQNDAIIFRRGEEICLYQGLLLTRDTLNEWYGEYTAPYAMVYNSDPEAVTDGAEWRGVGTIANHSNRPNARFHEEERNNSFYLVCRAVKNIRNRNEITINYGDDYDFNEPTSHTTRYVPNRRR